MIAVEIKHLSKTIKKNLILDDINLELKEGTLYGIIGRNGSGKTMLFRCMAGLVFPSSGEILYDGKVLHKEIAAPPNTSVIIENMGLYPEFTGFVNLKYLAGIRKIINDKEIKAAIARVGLDPDDKRTLKKYSLGMRQRIILAQAFMEHPDILLLDEPTNGLDESGVQLVRDILKEEAARGALILIASHNKEDISYLCDEVYHMQNGRLEDAK
jgi:ABC-2 type transport system ATP-binding protein